MSEKKITILLSTYNGERYLEKLLDSIYSQSYKNFEILARDDGSSDKSLEIIEKKGIRNIPSDKNIGVKKSFSLLLEYALKEKESEYFMFCDQDDIWDNYKIEKSMQVMEDMENKYGDIPLLIHSDLEVVSEELALIDKSYWHFENLEPSYNSLNRLLMKNTITGCTILLNKKLAKISKNIPQEAIMYDWWIGLVASSFGKIAFLKNTTIKYRQHNSNTVGANGLNARYTINKFFSRINPIEKNIIQGRAFLKNYKEILKENDKKIVEDFISLGEKGFLRKRFLIIKHGFFKHGFLKNIGLFTRI